MKQTFLQKTKRFFEPLKKDRMVYFERFITTFLGAVDRIIHIVFLERIVYYLENQNNSSFFIVLNVYILYIFLYFIFQIFSIGKGFPKVPNTVGKFVQNMYLKNFLKIDNNYIERYGTGSLVSIINTGIQKWGNLINFFIREFVGIIVAFFFTGYMLSKNNSLFFTVFICFYFIFYIISYFLNLKILKYRMERKINSLHHSKNVVKILMNKSEISQNNKIGVELKNLEYYDNKQIDNSIKMDKYLQSIFIGPKMITNIGIVLIFYYCGNLYLQGNLKISFIIGVVPILIIMKTEITKGIQFLNDFTREFTDVEKLWDFFDEAPLIEGYDKGKEFIYKKGDIEFEKVSYEYVKGKNILEDFSFKVKGGSITAFVGPSGGGKSTMAKLIGGYIQADKGEILVDGQKLSEVSLKSYYKNIGYLTQEPSVFDGTVLENLTYARDNEVSEKEIKEAIEMAKCEFIYDLPNGLETEIGERGVKLSGGQRQRLAIAKIILKNPKIVILDEPTSALDSFSEEQITIALNNLFKERTVIVIAHRLQTVKHADKIFLIENGKITEEGTHTSLQEKGGLYAKMLELQSGF
ncbi:ABC transporter ATP-binding protein [Candidatus Gracilibacteria bacterium]|nr:ABC transporter ATP-binding protein [Candidatus Gracilibacteria bacterium]